MQVIIDQFVPARTDAGIIICKLDDGSIVMVDAETLEGGDDMTMDEYVASLSGHVFLMQHFSFKHGVYYAKVFEEIEQ